MKEEYHESEKIPEPFYKMGLKSICKIIIDKDKISKGFFLKIKHTRRNLFLVTVYHTIPEKFINLEKNIEIYLKNGESYII